MKKYSFLLVLLVSLFFLIGCSETSFLGSTPSQDNDSNILAIKNFKAIVSDKDKLRDEVLAGAAEVDEKKQTVALHSVTIQYYDNTGKTVVNSNEGVLDLKTRNMVLKGNVRYMSPKNVLLETETINWDSKKGEISTEDRFVQKTKRPDGKTLMITGIGFKADRNLEKWVIKQQSSINVI